MKKISLIALYFLAAITVSNAATFTSIVSGNWDVGTTWDQTACSASCVAGVDYPGAGDIAIISTDHEVQVANGNKACTRVELNPSSDFAETRLWIRNGFNLNVSGDVLITASNSADDPLTRVLISSASSSLTVGGDIIFTTTVAANAVLRTASSNTVNLAGKVTITSEGTITPGTSSTFNFNGSSSQVLNLGSALTYNNITFNNSGPGVTLDGAITTTNVTGNITIGSGTTLNNGGFDIAFAGNWSNSGTFNAGTNKVTMSGAATTISSTTEFHDLTISNSVSVSSGNITITGTLEITSTNTFTTGGLVTLISNASGTARIAELTGGSISGDITMQRYVPTGVDSWRFLSSPVSGRTLADWDDDFATSGFPGSDNPGFSFTSIYTYDETVLGAEDNGYTAPSDISDAINVGEGYWVYLGPLPLTFDVTGPANTGNISLPITYTDDPGQPASEDGWNMVANPYPSSIDWDAAGWTKTSITPHSIYIRMTVLMHLTPQEGPELMAELRILHHRKGFGYRQMRPGQCLL